MLLNLETEIGVEPTARSIRKSPKINFDYVQILLGYTKDLYIFVADNDNDLNPLNPPLRGLFI
jgi:hypothetical protein